MATVVEHSTISPPPDSNIPAELSLPIVFFDMVWYDFPVNQSVLFFDFPGCSKSHFLDTIVPDLKRSLSLTLAQFLPLSGKIIHPTAPGNKPLIRYQSVDSVSFLVSESSADFSHLTGSQPRPCEEFYAFAPGLPPATRSEDSVSCPVLALQVTLFPGQGLCIGFVTHHAVADASTVVSFIRAWALINSSKPGGDVIRDRLAQANCLPFYDRQNVTNVNGLDSIYWDLIVELSCTVEPPPVKIPTGKLRATFVLKKDEINSLKDLVLARSSGPTDVPHLSSFTVVCALVWVCSARGELADDDETEYFGFVADCRARLKPAMPANYFGNCVALVKAELKHGEVKKGGPDGFVKAAKAIGEAIKENVYNENGILFGAEKWPEEYGKLVGKRQYGVAGSPRFDFYAADYGWGKAKKFEALFIDDGAALSLCKSRDFEGGLEIGLSKPMAQMDAFSRVFREVLSELCCSSNQKA
ncbi:anthocyanin 5-aromatic acyltransferase [Phtheirospermum japonicum]|uniref:Anthocyanin 5-aromatic acyltransferase n=1 Tax=Phtheirospermum japonicum TaxID=374723 RepID=A0A830BJC1_9LAMI|nr:anthocyanin 5-aromatic acyltransferase [Phtheirospermum japonicum]